MSGPDPTVTRLGDDMLVLNRDDLKEPAYPVSIEIIEEYVQSANDVTRARGLLARCWMKIPIRDDFREEIRAFLKETDTRRTCKLEPSGE